MDVNKEKCKALKKIRKKLADTLGVDLHQRECTYEGKCSGTCPKCKQEEEQLNRAIWAKSALAAGTVAATVGLTGCAQMFQPLEGDVQPVDPPSTVQELEGEAVEPEQETEADIQMEIEGMEEVGTTEEDTEEIYELEGDVVTVEPSENE